LLLLVVGTHLGWGYHARRQLTGQIESLRLRGEPTSPADFFPPPPVPDNENAAWYLRRASQSLHGDHPAWTRLHLLEIDFDEPLRPPLTADELACVREIVALEREALRHVAAAATRHAVHWPLARRSPMYLTAVPDLNQQRDVANLLWVAVLSAYEAGDHGEAIGLIRQMLFIGEALEREPSYVTHLVSLGIYTMAARSASDLAPGLSVSGNGSATSPAASAQQVRALVDALLDETSMREGQRFSLRAARAEQIDALTALADGAIHLDDVLIICPGEPADPRAWKILRPLLRPWILSDAALLCRIDTETLEATAEPTLPAFLARAPDTEARLRGCYPRHPFAMIMMPDYFRAARNHYLALADRRMAATALALRCYAADHAGRRPPRLADLVPVYLPAVPQDPFATDDRSLGYCGDPRRPLLYSVGPDGIDDGGSEFRSPVPSYPAAGEPKDRVLYLDGRLPGSATASGWMLYHLPWNRK
jgi:hypothetical protein